MNKLSEEILDVDVLDFRFANYKEAGPKIRELLFEVMEEEDLSIKAFSAVIGLKYSSLRSFINETFDTMSFKNMNIARKYLRNYYKDR